MKREEKPKIGSLFSREKKKDSYEVAFEVFECIEISN
jgi:hypothetical protein